MILLSQHDRLLNNLIILIIIVFIKNKLVILKLLLNFINLSWLMNQIKNNQ